MLFSIGSFNLRNLSLPGHEIYPDLSYTKEEYEAKLSWSRHQLVRMNADIVGFQEIFQQEALAELCAEEYGKNRPIVLNDQDNKPRVGLVSRFPIESYRSFVEFPEECKNEEFSEFRRPPLEAIIRLPNNTLLRVLVIHLKSKRPLFVDGERSKNLNHIAQATARSLRCRTAEALAIRKLAITDLSKPTLIIGDFNDTATSVTTNIILGPKPRHGLPHEEKQLFWRSKFTSVSDDHLKRSLRDTTYTHIHNGYYESIDHIVYSDHFSRKNQRKIGKSVYLHFFNDHVIDQSQGRVRMSRETSDHGQLVATFLVHNK